MYHAPDLLGESAPSTHLRSRAEYEQKQEKDEKNNMNDHKSVRRVFGQEDKENKVSVPTISDSSTCSNNNVSTAVRSSESPAVCIASKLTEDTIKGKHFVSKILGHVFNVNLSTIADNLPIRKINANTAAQRISDTVMPTTDETAEDTLKDESNGINSTDSVTEQCESGIKLNNDNDEDGEQISCVEDKPILLSTGVPFDILHKFPELPLEIREIIWKYAAVVEQGRIVQIKLDILGNPWKAISKTYVPAILHVCSDARKYALPYYYLLKCDDNHMPYGFRHTYINWETDALFFRTANTAHQFLHGEPMEDPSVEDGTDEPYYDALGRLVDTSGYDVWDGEKFVPPIPADAMAADSRGRRFPNELTIRKNCKKIIIPVEAAGKVIHPQQEMKELLFHDIEELYFVLDIPLNTIRMDFIEMNLWEVMRDDVRLQKDQRYEREGEGEDISRYYEDVLYLIDRDCDKLNRRKKPVKVMLVDLVNAGNKRRN